MRLSPTRTSIRATAFYAIFTAFPGTSMVIANEEYSTVTVFAGGRAAGKSED
jgi:hypothetical protein